VQDTGQRPEHRLGARLGPTRLNNIEDAYAVQLADTMRRFGCAVVGLDPPRCDDDPADWARLSSPAGEPVSPRKIWYRD
jgi:hypothetical protein